MRRVPHLLIALLAAALSACTEAPPEGFQTTLSAATPLPGEVRFAEVAARVEPVAEALCRQTRKTTYCNFKIVIDTREGQPPNAFQTIDRSGRPILGFTAALIANARNADELAFVMGHEASHHILGHIPQRAEQALSGALQAAILASAAGLDQAKIEKAAKVAAEAGARRFSKEFELQADALGTEIALKAGFDAVRGSAFFDRLPDPGNRFLGTHPANAQRKALVRATQKKLLGG